ncbi:MAG: DUF1572 family protein [Bacteroidia bacterium]|nr:DUF1572 family protein [Bacteroidia bacterium]
MTDIGKEFLAESIKSFHGLKLNAEKAIAQLSNQAMHFCPGTESNSIVIIMKHLSGNMISRWTDFMTTDGEKLNRNRDAEFIDDLSSREQLMESWNSGWSCLFRSLENVKEEDLMKPVYIRNEAHTVIRAIQRQLSHYAYHCGQIVYLAKMIRNEKWETLSIPRGESEKYLNAPTSVQNNK